ncbi:hypothetical protein MRX96_018659 [Rhipicephalus microplus]
MEAVALRRLRWIAIATNAFPSEQSGFRPSAVASARVIYTAAVASLSACQLAALDADHRNAVREYYELPHTSQVGPALAKAEETPISQWVTQWVLNHVLWLKTTMQGQLLLNRLYALPHSSMVQRASELLPVVPDVHYPSWPAIPPYRHIPLVITKTIGGFKAKVLTPLAAMQQQCSALLHEQLNDWLLVCVDGSVLRDGSAATACVVPLGGAVLK